MVRVVLGILVLLALDAAPRAADVPARKCGSQEKTAPAQRLANVARWSTASEEDTFAYDVYRGDSEKGKFVKLTKQPILGNGTTSETHKYEYSDDSIDPCKEYWYYVEEITNQNTRDKFTPVFKAPAKLHADGTPVIAAPKSK